MLVICYLLFYFTLFLFSFFFIYFNLYILFFFIFSYCLAISWLMTVSLLEEDLIFSPSYKFPTFFFKNSEILKMTLQRCIICLTFCQDVWCEIWEWLLLLYCTACTHLFYFSCLDGMTYNSPISKWVFFSQSQLKKWWQKRKPATWNGHVIDITWCG